MMDVAITLLHEDVPNVTWKRFVGPEDADQHDLVVAAYTLSEIASPEARKRTVQNLWKHTKGVLIIIEHANLPNFNILMEARDTILEEKGIGLWDWQPTILAPCPHEKRCPLRHAARGVKHKDYRVCDVQVAYRATFVERWVRRLPLMVSTENISYMIFARNELVPARAEQRQEDLKKEEERRVKQRDQQQRELYEAALTVRNSVYERASDEALHRPSTSLAPQKQENDAVSQSRGQTLPTEAPRWVEYSENASHKLIFPKQIAVATHRFNRSAYVDGTFQVQRVVGPAEVLVVREELDDIRKRFRKNLRFYYRVVRQPVKRGRVKLHLCTSDGDLIRGKVYRRFYGDMSRGEPIANFPRWEQMGGWRLAQHARSGWLFPHDVPLYSVTKVPQVDFPNTLVSHSMSTVEKTAMMHGDPLEHSVPPENEWKDNMKKEAVSEDMKYINATIATLCGSSEDSKVKEVDSRAPITSDEWTKAVRNAKRRVGETIRRSPKKYPVPKRYLQSFRYHGLIK